MLSHICWDLLLPLSDAEPPFTTGAKAECGPLESEHLHRRVRGAFTNYCRLRRASGHLGSGQAPNRMRWPRYVECCHAAWSGPAQQHCLQDDNSLFPARAQDLLLFYQNVLKVTPLSHVFWQRLLFLSWYMGRWTASTKGVLPQQGLQKKFANPCLELGGDLLPKRPGLCPTGTRSCTGQGLGVGTAFEAP